MARDPAERYASASEMASELRRWVDRHSSSDIAATEPVASADTQPHRPGVAEAASHYRGLPMAAIAVAAIAVAVGVALFMRSRTPAEAALTAPPAAAPATGAAIAAVNEPTTAAKAPGTPTVDGPPPASTLATAAVARTAARTAAASRAKPSPASIPHDTPVPAAAVVTGWLQLAISPWGQVEVDGTAAGTAPPLARLSLPEGTHTVTVRNDDFPPFTITVQVSADKPVTVRHRFGQ
jgi:serine/threonine-protein kinase